MDECIFCKIVKGEIPSKKLYEDDNVIVIMDVNPQVNGHALVIVKAKKGQTGKIVVKPESEGLKAGSVELMSK